MASLQIDGITYSAAPYVRHSADCKFAAEGAQCRKCNCPKWLLVYDGSTRKQAKISAKTRSWGEADTAANAWIDQFDPLKRELAELKAVKEREQVTIAAAVATFLKDMTARIGNNSRTKHVRFLLETSLSEWIAKQDPQPKFVTDLTAAHLIDWRASWTYRDVTAAVMFGTVKMWMRFCYEHGWTKVDVAAGIKRPKVAKGNRTATFSDDQYDAILAQANEKLIHTFLELLRWSGMSLIDAVLFERKLVGEDGVLRYTRRKTRTLATVKLPDHVIALLRSVDGEQPFKREGLSLDSTIDYWREELQELFTAAGIKKVMTDVGQRDAHPHMLRDTCAVWYLRHGMSLHGVAKVLGHANPTITAKHYLPFVKELEKAHIAENAAILAAAKPKSSAKIRAIR